MCFGQSEASTLGSGKPLLLFIRPTVVTWRREFAFLKRRCLIGSSVARTFLRHGIASDWPETCPVHHSKADHEALRCCPSFRKDTLMTKVRHTRVVPDLAVQDFLRIISALAFHIFSPVHRSIRYTFISSPVLSPASTASRAGITMQLLGTLAFRQPASLRGFPTGSPLSW